jgi:HK97 gp10 family phage protein
MTRTVTEVEGLKEATEAMRALPAKLITPRGGPLRFSVREMAKFVREVAKANVRANSYDTGRLERSIVMQIGKQAVRDRAIARGNTFENYVVGVNKGSSRKDLSGAFYGNPVEVGRTSVKGRGGKRKREAARAKAVEFGNYIMPPRPYMRPALEENRAQVIRIFVNAFGPAVERTARRIAGRVGKL